MDIPTRHTARPRRPDAPSVRVPRGDLSALSLVEMLRTVLDQPNPNLVEARRYAARLEDSVRAVLFTHDRE